MAARPGKFLEKAQVAEEILGDPKPGHGEVVMYGCSGSGNRYHMKLQCNSNCFDEHVLFVQCNNFFP